MSKRSNRNRNTVTLDRREIVRIVEAAIERKFTPPAGANVTPISQSVIDQMYASLAPQDKTQGYFSPGAPIRPVPGITPAQGPRQFQYTVGYNIGQLPRSTEMTSFVTLRNLAALCDAISICERVWFDLCSKPELEIRPRPERLVDEKGDPVDPSDINSKYGTRIQKWKDFFAKPDKRRSLKQWMRMALRDVLELDALAIYKHKDRSGGLYALEILDGSTIKPLLDERGMAPYPPYPAYQQFVYGVPGMLILDSDLIYRREVERTDSPYGFSRTEAVIVRVNQILRKENKDLSTFTAGNIPPGFFSPPDDGTTDWTPEQLLMMQEMWDGILAGNDETRSRGRWVPPGTVYTKTDSDDIMVEFDDFLYTVVFGAFGVPKTEASFTEKSNRSTGETQEAMVYRRTMAPIMDIFGETFTDVMVDEGETDLMAAWKAFEEPEDLKTKAEAWNILVGNGTQSTSQAAHAMGLKPMFETEPFVITKDGPVFIKDAMDLRQPTMDAKTAALQMAKDNPGGMQNEQGTQPGTQGAQAGKNGAATAKDTTGQSSKNDRANAASTTTRNTDAVVPGQSSDAERTALFTELRRWRDVAIKSIEAGKPATWRGFVSDIIPGDLHEHVVQNLTGCTTVEDIRSLFKNVQIKRDSDIDPEQTSGWQEADPVLQGELKRALDAGYTHGTWKESPNPCEACLLNRGVKVKLGQTFPSGAYYTPNHNHCGCEIVLSKEGE